MVRVARRSTGRAGSSSRPVRKRIRSTSRPCSFNRARISSLSIESSDAHVLEVVRKSSVPPSSDSGTAWSAMRGPTAARQTTNGTAGRLGA